MSPFLDKIFPCSTAAWAYRSVAAARNSAVCGASENNSRAPAKATTASANFPAA